MDRKAWIAVTLSVIGLIGWYYYFVIVAPPPTRVAAPKPTATAAPSAAPTAAATATASPAGTPSLPVISARSESLSGRTTEYVFSNDLGGIQRANLLLHYAENHQYVSLNNDLALPIGSIGTAPGEPLRGFEMQVDADKKQAVFSKQDADGVTITKRFILPAQDASKDQLYVVRLEIEFSNPGAAPITRPSYFVSTGGAAPIHANDLPYYTRFDWMHDGKFQKIDVNWFSAASVPLVGIQWSPAKQLYIESKEKTGWAAATSQYFCTIVSTADPNNPAGTGTGVWASRFDITKANNAHVFGIQGGLQMSAFTIAPGSTVKQSFTIYAGPKELAQLTAMKGGQEAVLDFGMFGFVSVFLLWGMNTLNGLFHSYAIAIIVLTLIIKSLLWPIQNKATNEMRKMSVLSPKMTELREKYKDDPQKMNEETMKLYREYGVNPFSGCLPMLIQIPIFFGFYTMLGSAIELRNSSFFWVQDLSQPDTVGHILGFPINLLPLVMACTNVWQMVITPKSGDAMQQRIFYFMPIIFLVFCYNYASGLALYWTTQNLFSIVQLYLTRNRPLPTLEKKSAVAKREASAQKKKKRRPGQ